MAITNIELGLKCPYCGRETKLDLAEAIYGPGAKGHVRRCEPCFAYVGCHRDSTEAKGRVAKVKLRELKRKAHLHFDKIWLNWQVNGFESKHIARTKCYYWLAKKLDLPREETHIGMFDELMCEKVINLTQNLICDGTTLNEITSS